MQKKSISYETSSNFHRWQHDKRTSFAASPIDTARPQENQRLETRHVGAPKRAFRARPPPIFTLCSFKIDVFLRVFLRTSKFCNLKIDVSCEASVNFHHIAQNATPATEFAPCRHLTQPCQCNLQKTRSTTRLRCCACHEKWRWTLPKCCACHENCNTSSENVAKVLRLPRKTTFDTLQNTSECHEVPRLPDGCARERNVERTHPQPPDP